MTATITDVAQLVDNYIAIWNETDAAARQALIARTWTEDGIYVDPILQSEGHAGIDAMTAGAQAQYPGLKFLRTGEVDAHHDVLRFSWVVGPAGEPPIGGGIDVASVVDGRLRSIVGFFDFMPGAGS